MNNVFQDHDRDRLLRYLTGESLDYSGYEFDFDDLSTERSGNKPNQVGTISQVMGELFEGVKFDRNLIKKLTTHNVEFITRNHEVRDFMGGKLIGCFKMKYTQYHKDIFYQDVFDLRYDDVRNKIKEITTIPSNFQIARDDINLVCFYVLHRFLSNRDLSKQHKHDGAMEILNYFGYRTLILLSSNYWIYPISRELATTLSESLSKNYLITNLKNWNEYVSYRSDNYLKGNYVKVIIPLSNDKEVPNAINDFYNRFKDTLLNIYQDQLRLEDEAIIGSSRNVVTDLEGRDILMDRIGDPRSYIDKTLNSLSSKEQFIRRDLIEVSTSIITSISQEQLRECLEMVLEFYYKNPKNTKLVSEFINDFLVDTFKYLQERGEFINNRSNVIKVVNLVVGNILYSRGLDVSITAIKDRGEKLIKDIYKINRVTLSDRNRPSMRNIFCVYILLLSLI